MLTGGGCCLNEDLNILFLHPKVFLEYFYIQVNVTGILRELLLSLIYKLFQGGKHGQDPQLFEDQRMPHNRMAKQKIDPVSSDPFDIIDVTSRYLIVVLYF